MLAAIKRRLLDTGEGSSAPIALQGILGIGKTTMAATLVHDPLVKQKFVDGVLWATLGDDPHPHLILRRWAALFGIQGADLGDFPGNLSTRLAALIHNQRMLLVLDDVWDMADVRYLLIGGHQSRSLVSTRQWRVANSLAVTPSDIFKVMALTRAQSEQLLLKHAPEISDPQMVDRMVKLVDGLPLALHIAAQLMGSLQALSPDTSDQVLIRHILTAGMPADYIRANPRRNQTIELALENYLAYLSPTAQRAFFALGKSETLPAAFEASSLQSILSEARIRTTVRELVNSGLLDVEDGGRLSLHPLLRAFAKSINPEK